MVLWFQFSYIKIPALVPKWHSVNILSKNINFCWIKWDFTWYSELEHYFPIQMEKGRQQVVWQSPNIPEMWEYCHQVGMWDEDVEHHQHQHRQYVHLLSCYHPLMCPDKFNLIFSVSLRAISLMLLYLMAVNVKYGGHVDADCLVPTCHVGWTCLSATNIHFTSAGVH